MKTLQTEVLQRFLNDKDFNSLIKEYTTHRKTKGGSKRKFMLEIVPTEEDKAILEAYLTDMNTPCKDIHKYAGYVARSTAIRLLYQNQGVLGRLIK